MREEYTEEDIQIDPKFINASYQRLLKNGRFIFLEELRNMAINDYELENDGVVINRAFDLMKKFIGSSGNRIESMTLDDWYQFGLKKDVVNRIGYLAHHYDGLSPKGRRKITKQFSSATKSSEDNYEDDFEEIEEEESVSTLRNNFMDGSQNASSIKTGSECGSHNYRYDSKIDDEELTVDSKVRTTANAIAMKYSYHDEEVYSDIEEYTDDHISIDKTPRVPANESPPRIIGNRNLQLPSKSPQEPHHSNKQQPTQQRPQSTMSAVPLKPTTQVHRLQVEKLTDPKRAVTADSSPHNSKDGSGHRRNSSASTSVSTARGKTASWISNGEWRLGEKIGSGSFGEVFQCLNHKGKLFAVKRMSMVDKSSEVDNLLQEIQLMRGFSHVHIVAYLGAWVDADECVLYIFQEWVPGGSVAHLLKNFGPFPLGVVRQYTRQILYGLQYLHNNGIIHRDIKGGNILVDDSGTVKLADFGASTQLNTFNKTQETSTIKGTPYFMAPEVLANSRYGRKGDIWAVGCTMIQMLTGEPPWKDKNLKGLVQLHMLLANWEGPPEYSSSIHVTPPARECLEMCFQKKETDRPNATELLDCEFLRDDDDMDESFALSTGHHDPFEDSGILSGLKNEMNKAVTRSAQGLAKNRLNGDDTLAVIEAQIHDRQQSRQGRQKLPVNPYGSKASAQQNPFKSAGAGGIGAGAKDLLPPSQFGAPPLKPSTPPTVSTQMIDVHTPIREGPRPNTYSNGRYPDGGAYSHLHSSSNPNTPMGLRGLEREKGGEYRDISIPVSQSVAAGGGGVNKSSNPFTRGNTSLKTAQSQQVEPPPSLYRHESDGHSNTHAGAGGAGGAVRSGGSRVHALMNMSMDNHQQNGHNSNNNNVGHAPVVKDSLSGIKKKAAESKSSSSSASSINRFTPREYNQSSNRDEDITPWTEETSDVEDGAEDYGDEFNYNSSHPRLDSKSDSGKHYSQPPKRYVMRREDSIDIIEEKPSDVSNYYASDAHPRHRGSSAGRSESKATAHDDDEDSEPELIICSPSKVPVHHSSFMSDKNTPTSLNLAGVTPSSGLDSGGRRGSNSSLLPVTSPAAALNKPLSAKNRSKLPPAVDPQFSRLPSNPHMTSEVTPRSIGHMHEVTPRSARLSSPPSAMPGAPLDDYQSNISHSHSGDGDTWTCVPCKAVNVGATNYCVVCAVRRGADGRKGVGAIVRRL